MQPQLQIPRYQRRYQWGKEQISRLLNDCFFGIEHGLDDHFLGTVIIHRDGNDYYVVDGQQRLSTVILVLAALRDSAQIGAQVKSEIQGLIETGAQASTGTPARPRLLPGRSDQQAFIAHIWPAGGTTTFAADAADATRYPKALRIIATALEERNGLELLRFLLDHCKVVRLETASEDLAFKIFETVNDTGLKLSEFDITRYKLAKHAAAGDTCLLDQLLGHWDEAEAEFGSANLHAYIKAARRRLLRGRQPNRAMAQDFVAELAEPAAAQAFLTSGLRDGLEVLTRQGDRIGELEAAEPQLLALRTSLELADIPNSTFEKDWFPIYETFLGYDRDLRRTALKLLEARQWHAYFEVYGRGYMQNRSTMYAAVLGRLHSGDPAGALDVLRLSDVEKAEICSTLTGRIDDDEVWIRSLLARIELELHGGDVRAAPSRQNISIEHVLPRNPSTTSTWYKNFGRDRAVIEEFSRRLGNLSAVTEEVNQELKNLAFTKKRSIVRMKLPENYLTARDLRTEDGWTKDVIKRRSKWMLKVFCDALGLRSSNGEE
jgi:hypothetical protein